MTKPDEAPKKPATATLDVNIDGELFHLSGSRDEVLDAFRAIMDDILEPGGDASKNQN